MLSRPKGKTYPIPIVALLAGAFAHMLDFGDTLTIGVIHSSMSIIKGVLDQGDASDAPPGKLLTAQSVG